MKLKYKSPNISEKKLKISFFLSHVDQNNPFQMIAELYADTNDGGCSGDCSYGSLPDISNSKA